MILLLILLSVSTVVLFANWWRVWIKLRVFKARLAEKDRIISGMMRALPILFVENFKDPDYNKERDGSFVFYTQTRTEYDGRFVEVKWICQGNKKDKYNSLMMKYFKYLDSLGVDVHPILLGDRPYSGRVMIESFNDLDEDEVQTPEESANSVRKIGNLQDGDNIPVC